MSENDLKRISKSNRTAWNEVMPLHQRGAKKRVENSFSKAGYVRLDEY